MITKVKPFVTLPKNARKRLQKMYFSETHCFHFIPTIRKNYLHTIRMLLAISITACSLPYKANKQTSFLFIIFKNKVIKPQLIVSGLNNVSHYLLNSVLFPHSKENMPAM